MLHPNITTRHNIRIYFSKTYDTAFTRTRSYVKANRILTLGIYSEVSENFEILLLVELISREVMFFGTYSFKLLLNDRHIFFIVYLYRLKKKLITIQ